MLVGLGSSSWALGIGVAVFTFFSGIASAFLLVINIRCGQHYNYVSMLAVIIALYNFNSFAQQIYTLLNFAELMVEAFELATAMFRCAGTEPFPLFHTTDKNVSAFLSIQMFVINAQGLLFFYWSLILFASSWSLNPSWWKNQKAIIATKISCFALPGLQLGVLRLKILQGNDFAQLMIMDCIVLINIGMGSVFLVLTLIHVISVHRAARGATEVRLSRKYDGVVEFQKRDDYEKGLKKASTGIGRLYVGSDGWLIARIALAFVMVEGLKIYTIVMQIFFLQRWAHFRIEWSRGLLEPLVDQSEEFANICSPIPGSFTGYLFFFVFGTTTESRTEIRKIRFAIRKWFCACFGRGRSKSVDGGGEKHQSLHSKRPCSRTFGSRSISYPKPESDSLLLSPGRSTVNPSPSMFSASPASTVLGFPPGTVSSSASDSAFSPRHNSTPSISSPPMSALLRPLSTRDTASDYSMFEYDGGCHLTTFPHSPHSEALTDGSFEYLVPVVPQRERPVYRPHVHMHTVWRPAPATTKRIFCERLSRYTPSMIMSGGGGERVEVGGRNAYFDMRRESG